MLSIHCYTALMQGALPLHLDSSLDLGPGPRLDDTRLLAATPSQDTWNIQSIGVSRAAAVLAHSWRAAGAGARW